MGILAASIRPIPLDCEYIDAQIELIKSCILLAFPVSRIILFGSCARKTAVLGSDIDLLVLSAQHSQLNQMRKIILTSIRNSEIPIDWIFASEQQYNSMHNASALLQIVQTEGITIYDAHS